MKVFVHDVHNHNHTLTFTIQCWIELNKCQCVRLNDKCYFWFYVFFLWFIFAYDWLYYATGQFVNWCRLNLMLFFFLRDLIMVNCRRCKVYSNGVFYVIIVNVKPESFRFVQWEARIHINVNKLKMNLRMLRCEMRV